MTEASFISSSTPRFTDESKPLLRIRLKAAAWIACFGVLLFFVRDLVSAGLGATEDYPINLTVLGFHLFVLLAIGISAGLLSTSRPLSLRQLRGLEMLVFWLVIAYLALDQYRAVVKHAGAGEGPMVLVVFRSFMFGYFLVMVVHGLLIPNDWRGAARTVMPLALALPLVNWIASTLHPPVRETLIEVASFEQISISVALMMVGATTVIYGAHVMNTLRREAFEARQMGQYRLKSKIGSGGMGEVWAAEHQMLARPVAVKLIRPEMLESTGETSSLALRRFEREAQATARLRSPQTVEVHDFGAMDDGSFYYVMELLEGISLADLVDKFGPLRPDRAVYLLRQVCESLAEAHDMGLIHRDIKPTNIFTCRFGLSYDFIKVLDFGLVKQAGSVADTRLTGVGLVVGTPAFIAPELATNAAGADARSDIYSLGCVAYWLVTGKLVFESETPMGMILEHVQKVPIPPSKRSEVSLPSQLQEVILSCLEKEPGRRPKSALSLIEALDSCGPFGWDQRAAREWWDKHKPTNVTGESKQ